MFYLLWTLTRLFQPKDSMLVYCETANLALMRDMAGQSDLKLKYVSLKWGKPRPAQSEE